MEHLKKYCCIFIFILALWNAYGHCGIKPVQVLAGEACMPSAKVFSKASQQGVAKGCTRISTKLTYNHRKKAMPGIQVFFTGCPAKLQAPPASNNSTCSYSQVFHSFLFLSANQKRGPPAL